MAFVGIGMGSNLGQRDWYLDRAIERLKSLPGFWLQKESSYYETAPVGGPADAGAYLNAVVTGISRLSPEDLLRVLLQIEKEFGRQRSIPNAPRTLDLDLLFYDQQIRTEDPLVPHPRMHERHFVLIPLNEICSTWVHPIFQKSIADLTQSLPEIADPPQIFPKARGFSQKGLLGKKALVTGSTSGIGQAIAWELAQLGADVIIHGKKSLDPAQTLAQQIKLLGSQARVILADLAEPSQCARLAQEAWDTWGKIDILVNNAGVDLLTTEAKGWDYAQKWKALLEVDVNATVYLSRWLGQKMRASSGTIINMGWDQAETGMAGENPELFSMAKAAVMAFTRSLSLSLAPTVRVNCVAPGWIKTAWGEQVGESWQQRVKEETPLARWGLPEDVARAVAWLCGDGGSFITGQIIRINGGVVR
ncbi:MAG: 2-amino-4-hydroxy-6-hydroxymethyldihydropteridine diphosphokinase [Gemmataceae bacterium]|nr:2-amino-4-hydroxy-6-hydroxymethyldihydropteridine diphosphokinase [Gemmataceae bacterium]